MIAPRSTEVGAWKENVARKATQRVKPTSAILIKKYPRQRQDGVYTTQRKRLRLLGYRYGPISPASHRRGPLQHLGCAWPCGGGTEGRAKDPHHCQAEWCVQQEAGRGNQSCGVARPP
jgi:hypothetical protein